MSSASTSEDEPVKPAAEPVKPVDGPAAKKINVGQMFAYLLITWMPLYLGCRVEVTFEDVFPKAGLWITDLAVWQRWIKKADDAIAKIPPACQHLTYHLMNFVVGWVVFRCGNTGRSESNLGGSGLGHLDLSAAFEEFMYQHGMPHDLLSVLTKLIYQNLRSLIQADSVRREAFLAADQKCLVIIAELPDVDEVLLTDFCNCSNQLAKKALKEQREQILWLTMADQNAQPVLADPAALAAQNAPAAPAALADQF